MKWMQIMMNVRHEAVEAVSDMLTGLGSGGVELDDPRVLNFYLSSGLWDYTDLKEEKDTGTTAVKAWLPVDGRLEDRLHAVEKGIFDVASRIGNPIDGDILFAEMDEEDWSESWKQYFHPVRVGEKIVIKPTWEDYDKEDGDIVIEIDPGMAFGTGTHHTTCLCIKALEKYVKEGMTVFDAGTGSGILSLAAAFLGTKSILATDLDETAVKVAKENIALNGCDDKITVFCADLLSVAKSKADIIVANIIASVIIELVKDISAKLNDGGVFIASGIIAERADEVLKSAASAGLVLKDREDAGGWVAFTFCKG